MLQDAVQKKVVRPERRRELLRDYVPAPKNFDSIIVGYYERDDLIYVARVRAGFRACENARTPSRTSSAPAEN